MKLIDYIIKKRVEEALKKMPISYSQIGFRQGLGTEINLNFVTQTIHKNLNKLEEGTIEDPWLLFIDFKGAFNSINHELLYDKLKQKKVS